MPKKIPNKKINNAQNTYTITAIVLKALRVLAHNMQFIYSPIHFSVLILLLKYNFVNQQLTHFGGTTSKQFLGLSTYLASLFLLALATVATFTVFLNNFLDLGAVLVSSTVLLLELSVVLSKEHRPPMRFFNMSLKALRYCLFNAP